MTLIEALEALQAAGKIKQVHLPGMKLVGQYKDYPIRVHDFGERAFDTEDMRDSKEPWLWWVESDRGDGGPYRGPYEPDETDPATTGCLVYLWREAVAHSAPTEVDPIWDSLPRVIDLYSTDPDISGPAGAMLARALIALATAAGGSTT